MTELTFKEWFVDDDHDLYNYPEEEMQKAWNAALATTESKEPVSQTLDCVKHGVSMCRQCLFEKYPDEDQPIGQENE